MIDGVFCNSLQKDKPPVGKVIRWKLSPNPQRKEKKKDVFKLDVCRDSIPRAYNDILIWLGHSSFFMRINECSYLIDPIFSDLPTAKRKVLNPYTVQSLGKVDYILISHAHFDHFDINTVKEIVKWNPDVEILGPLGINKLLKEQEFERIRIQEAGWFQIFDTKGGNEITYLPAKHWHRRSLFDFNKILWGGFGIRTNKLKIYFAGDTAMDINFFRQIREIYDDFDICILPIGAYSPQFLMADEHINPREAIDAFVALNGNYLIPMHYGTYDMSDEPLGEPIRLLHQYASENNITDRILDLPVGKLLQIDNYIDNDQ